MFWYLHQAQHVSLSALKLATMKFLATFPKYFCLTFLHIMFHLSLFANHCSSWVAKHNSLFLVLITVCFSKKHEENMKRSTSFKSRHWATEETAVRRADTTSLHTPSATVIGLLALLALFSLKVENLSCRSVLPESLWAARCWLLGNVSSLTSFPISGDKQRVTFTPHPGMTCLRLHYHQWKRFTRFICVSLSLSLSRSIHTCSLTLGYSSDAQGPFVLFHLMVHRWSRWGPW